ncbi:hypothetical protein M2372_004601 [Chryseobacterium sp. BIGb0232]|nr:hypothetical protein [Chryseobacterium sp. BIGb0232]ROS07735.1 hypothetical protein EDF65_4850 [Chryseobacterium nakagawai]
MDIFRPIQDIKNHLSLSFNAQRHITQMENNQSEMTKS